MVDRAAIIDEDLLIYHEWYNTESISKYSVRKQNTFRGR